ncbi:Uncharacterised protein [Enterobacter hormaechei]|nr:Uncharacterised protein [Enterobacter hormaechei]
MHPLLQLGQYDFSGPFEPFNISLVINQFNKHTDPLLSENCLCLICFRENTTVYAYSQ